VARSTCERTWSATPTAGARVAVNDAAGRDDSQRILSYGCE
jgi:hypothetical protein